MALKPADMILRCYAERVDGQWQAFCLDLTLAAQGDDFAAARAKLHDMIVEYVTDAVAGQDRAYAGPLLTRRAPFPYWAKFYWLLFLDTWGGLAGDMRRLFTEVLPLVPPGVPIGHA
ncbi:MAG: hypothetical protein HY423_09265 [Candidatus Lambdaproteobacteria bacterium]|nr:hypothetical protein [Candidatus Lambdaproteobacteria bacterium]